MVRRRHVYDGGRGPWVVGFGITPRFGMHLRVSFMRASMRFLESIYAVGSSVDGSPSAVKWMAADAVATCSLSHLV